jgi:hypothetical protein
MYDGTGQCRSGGAPHLAGPAGPSPAIWLPWHQSTWPIQERLQKTPAVVAGWSTLEDSRAIRCTNVRDYSRGPDAVGVDLAVQRRPGDAEDPRCLHPIAAGLHQGAHDGVPLEAKHFSGKSGDLPRPLQQVLFDTADSIAV